MQKTQMYYLQLGAHEQEPPSPKSGLCPNTGLDQEVFLERTFRAQNISRTHSSNQMALV